MFELPQIEDIVARALAEDLGVPPATFLGEESSAVLLERDATTWSVIGEDDRFVGTVVAREACTVCGLPVAAAVFEALSTAAGLFDPVEFFPLVAEGSRVEAGIAVAEVDGLARAVLAAERTALDFLMVLSGIATETTRWVDLAREDLAVCDTRKTVPGLRDLSKYAVRVGGGTNHRAGLYDLVLVKDNHLKRAGGISSAAEKARLLHPDLTLEIEADSVEQAVEAVRAGADMVLLDNMDDGMRDAAVVACREAASARGRAVLLEVSGNVTRSQVTRLAQSGVDRISSSSLTFARPVDFALDEG